MASSEPTCNGNEKESTGQASSHKCDLGKIVHLEGPLQHFPKELEKQLKRHLKAGGREDFAMTK